MGAAMPVSLPASPLTTSPVTGSTALSADGPAPGPSPPGPVVVFALSPPVPFWFAPPPTAPPPQTAPPPPHGPWPSRSHSGGIGADFASRLLSGLAGSKVGLSRPFETSGYQTLD